jgi:antitoxin VapB
MVERWNSVALNIKNEETHRLAKELATLQGVSIVVAVTKAVEEKLEREKAARPEGRLERIRKIVERTALRWNDGRSSKELIDELYDEETGLPK